MMLSMMKGKIHRATVTRADLDYVGSLTLDPVLMRAAGMLPNEHVHVLNLANGNRFQTYIIEGQADSGEVCLNGAAAHLGKAGDLVIALCFASVPAAEARDHVARTVLVDAGNRVTDVRLCRSEPTG